MLYLSASENLPGMMGGTCNLSTQDAKAGGLPQLQGQSGLTSKF